MAGARKGRERELLSFLNLPRAPKFPLPVLNACHAGYLEPESKMGRDSGCGMRDAEVQDCAKILVGMMRLKNPIEDTSL